jgi:putative Mg2+ transporter-C (MgtC) family protein
MDPFSTTMLIRLLVAMLCGMVLGAERVLASKSAGLRTYALVSIGSALFVLISESVVLMHPGGVDADPLRMAAQIVTGIGFLGAGIIMVRKDHVVGVTTASGIWVAAAIGTAAGFGLFWLAITATLLTLFIFVVLWFVERAIEREISPFKGSRGESDRIGFEDETKE